MNRATFRDCCHTLLAPGAAGREPWRDLGRAELLDRPARLAPRESGGQRLQRRPQGGVGNGDGILAVERVACGQRCGDDVALQQHARGDALIAPRPHGAMRPLIAGRRPAY